MARTKQGARRSTGLRAPRDERMRRLRITDDPSRRVPQATEAERLVITVPACTSTVSLRSKSNDSGDATCTYCHNGGRITNCDTVGCDLGYCDLCIVDLHKDMTGDQIKKMVFECPSCFCKRMTENNVAVSSKPYLPWGSPGGSKIEHRAYICPQISGDRTSYPRIDTSPLAILVFTLKGLPSKGLPPNLVVATLEGYFTGAFEGNLIVHNVEFAIKSKSMLSWTRQLDTIVKELERKKVKRIGVFVLTHSDPGTGDMHVREGASCTPDNFLSILLGGQLHGFIKNATSAILVLLVCGGPFQVPDARYTLEQYVDGDIFDAIIGFGRMDFVPHTTGVYLVKVFKRYFLNRKPIRQTICTFLYEEISMGAHSDVWTYLSRTCSVDSEKFPPSNRNWVLIRYIWAHKNLRPFTVPRPIQCHGCACIHSFQTDAYAERNSNGKPERVVVLFLCSRCGRTEKRELNKGLCVLADNRSLVHAVNDPKWASGAQGEWCVEYVEPAVGSSNV